MTEPQLITREEAIEAVRRCAFTVAADPDYPDDTNVGREIVHCFTGGPMAIGADWDAEAAVKLIDDPMTYDGVPQIAWADAMFGRCLHVWTPEGRMRIFDTVTPPPESKPESKPCACPAYVEEFAAESYHTVDAHRRDCNAQPPCGGCWGCIASQSAYYADRKGPK